MKIRERLFELQDFKYRDFHSRLCSNNNNIIGVRIPVLKKLAKDLYKDDNQVLSKIGNKYYEEIMLQGLLITLSTETIKNKIELIKKFVPKIDNWAICDTFCSGLKIKNNEEDIYWNFLKQYYNSQNEFELRFLLVMLLDHYLKESYLDLICDIIKNITSTEYYVKMAKAWLLSIMYIKYPIYTLKKINDLNLDVWTYNKVIQKIIESKRVAEEEKMKLRKLKK